MSTPEPAETEPSGVEESDDATATTTYEILRARLTEVATGLAAAATELNNARAAAFSPVAFALSEQDRIHTRLAAHTRDVVSVGELLLVGHNPVQGVTTDRTVAEVFSVFRMESHPLDDGGVDWIFTNIDDGDPAYFLDDPQFARSFRELYDFYAGTELEAMEATPTSLRMTFRAGTALRVLRWEITPSGQIRFSDAHARPTDFAALRYDFAWEQIGRNRVVDGRWPHFDLDGELFVGIERVDQQARLGFRVNSAASGGVALLVEDLDEAGQDLTELRVQSAQVDDFILVRIVPYNEPDERFYVFNRLTSTLRRIDAVGFGCHRLPERQGLLFPGGYCLQNGQTKTYPSAAEAFSLVGCHRSPNSEDILYVAHDPATGRYQLLRYNLVARQLDTPVVCGGYALFDDGTIVTVREGAQAQKVHTVAVYSSPFSSPEFYASTTTSDGFFGRVGNAELVDVCGESAALALDVRTAEFNAGAYESLVARASRVLDSHAWIAGNDADAPTSVGPIRDGLIALRQGAGDVLDEFTAITAARANAARLLGEVGERIERYATSLTRSIPDTAAYLELIGASRAAHGALASASEDRYVDRDALAELGERLSGGDDLLRSQAVRLFAQDTAFTAILDDLERVEAAGAAATNSPQVTALVDELDEAAERLSTLAEMVSELGTTLSAGPRSPTPANAPDSGDDLASIDPNVVSGILTRLSSVLARRNAVRAGLRARFEELRRAEATASFGAAMGVLSERAAAEAASATTAAMVDGALGQLLAQLETLDLTYGDIAEFAAAVETKRTELSNAFLARRDELAAAHHQLVSRLVNSSNRVIDTLSRRATAAATPAVAEAVFASDPLAVRVRDAASQLTALGEGGRASELIVALSAARDSARRVVGDRAELGGEGTVRIGSARFDVCAERAELRVVGVQTADGRSGFEARLTPTDLAVAVRDPRLEPFADLAERSYPTETGTLPRAVYLGLAAVFDVEQRLRNATPTEQRDALAESVTAIVGSDVGGGFEPGVHDADARLVAHAAAALLIEPALRHLAVGRALFGLWWESVDDAGRSEWERRLTLARLAGDGTTRDATLAGLDRALDDFVQASGLETLDGDGWPTARSAAAEVALDRDRSAAVDATTPDIVRRAADVAAAANLQLPTSLDEVVRWVLDTTGADLGAALEAAWLVTGTAAGHAPRVLREPSTVTVDGLLSTHPMITGGSLTLDLGDAVHEYRHQASVGAARFEAFATIRREIALDLRDRFLVDELQAHPISSFVRNRLVDEVLLPLVGTNFARQLGLSDAAQGLLLLVSPPGYGKTTLIEYVADLLGFSLVKVSGPALGHDVTSLDPAGAPNVAAARELRKLNQAFAMGTNVICYVDDVQHTSPDFLSRFIPLCDATRRIEGVDAEGVGTTYELSGKRFIMVMAGNPYTSEGGAFRIPDMLANRADVHNLGEVAASHGDAFAQSYIENAAAVCPEVAPIAARGRRSDLEAVLHAAATGAAVRSDQLSTNFGGDLDRAVLAARNLCRVRDALLAVNAAYIGSAAQTDELRGEPPFLLQGSYRNMARIAARVVGAMTSNEVDALVAEHYQAESQTLAAAARWNQLRLQEVLGVQAGDGGDELAALRARWTEAHRSGDASLDAIVAALAPLSALDRLPNRTTATPRLPEPPLRRV